MDAKGRFVVPSKYREIINNDNNGRNDQLVVTGHPHNFLLIMLWSDYVDMEKRLGKMPDSGDKAEYYKQTLIGMAVDDLSLDSAGRLKLSKALIKHARLESEIALVGMREHIRIWSKKSLDRLNAAFSKAGPGNRSLPDGWDDFSV